MPFGPAQVVFSEKLLVYYSPFPSMTQTLKTKPFGALLTFHSSFLDVNAGVLQSQRKIGKASESNSFQHAASRLFASTAKELASKCRSLCVMPPLSLLMVAILRPFGTQA